MAPLVQIILHGSTEEVERTSGGNRVGMVIINNIKKMLLIIGIHIYLWGQGKVP